MGLFSSLLGGGSKAAKAMEMQKKGNAAEALKLYKEIWDEGKLNDARTALGYALLLLRTGDYALAKEVIVKTQKLPMTPDQKTQMYVDYAVCCLKLGDREKALRTLEKQHQRQPSGLMYQTLGYVYADCYDAANKPDLASFLKLEEALKAQNVKTEDPRFPTPEAQPVNTEEAEDQEGEEIAPAAEAPVQPSDEERLEIYWEECRQKVLAFNEEAVDYDDEDPICLDNLGQTWYRVFGDKAKAKEWFDKAIAIKPGQIDTLWFLSRYDLENGDRAAAAQRLEKALEGHFSPLNYVDEAAVRRELARIKK